MDDERIRLVNLFLDLLPSAIRSVFDVSSRSYQVLGMTGRFPRAVNLFTEFLISPSQNPDHLRNAEIMLHSSDIRTDFSEVHGGLSLRCHGMGPVSEGDATFIDLG
jgi:hypothetical protein